ncbi:hypothetical protein CB0940_11065 [Cercospora beticola]|uniref:Uncharacterized protein n=1 Tax=Cercospora beticola TaxID=122368 RepID=A0A2G5HDB4_CERBT|nr:hypothetical protein CB0940_11065 [Cercospora beticola]PIA90556.1 hypothetical protein CB0940_11065 [Cercospora beticola]WPB07895.1 hypothetical protein RHO25_012559 [Cercospora beticola]
MPATTKASRKCKAKAIDTGSTSSKKPGKRTKTKADTGTAAPNWELATPTAAPAPAEDKLAATAAEAKKAQNPSLLMKGDREARKAAWWRYVGGGRFLSAVPGLFSVVLVVTGAAQKVHVPPKSDRKLL